MDEKIKRTRSVQVRLTQEEYDFLPSTKILEWYPNWHIPFMELIEKKIAELTSQRIQKMPSTKQSSRKQTSRPKRQGKSKYIPKSAEETKAR